MDTLTHGLAGALLGRALPPPRGEALKRSLARREPWLGFAAAMFPDADALLAPLSPEFYITQHRGLSHSFLVLPLWALLLAAGAAWRLPAAPRDSRREAFTRLSVVAAVGIASHILLDWITSWGTMFFSPLSWERYTLDWVFIVDLVLSGLLLLGLFSLPFITRRTGDLRGRWAARASLVSAVLYIGFCGLKHAEALRVAEAKLPRASRIAVGAIPQPLSPDRWLLVADDGSRITASFTDLGKSGRAAERTAPSARTESVELLGEAEASRHGLIALVRRLTGHYRSRDDLAVRVIPKADGPLAEKTMAEGASGVFGRFARFPAAREERDPDGGTRVVMRDVRFGYLTRDVDPFTFVAAYDPLGRLVSAGFPSPRWARNGIAAGKVAATHP